MLVGSSLAALALLVLGAGQSQAQYVVYSAPRVVTYYTPPPTVTYYVPAAPVYVTPTTTVTTYRYGAILPRRRVTVTTYYTPAVSYASPVYYYP
jgi:hypothetical protein